MTQQEKQILNELSEGLDSYERDFADRGPAAQPDPGDLQLGIGFAAQFDISVSILFFTHAAGVYTSIAPGSINVALRTRLPVFLFGFSDFEAGFAKMKQQYPVTGGWVYNNPFVFGKDRAETLYSVIDANVSGQLRDGDLVLPFTSGGLNTAGFVVVRSNNVAYATLMGALASDKFVLNKLRYIVDNASQAQYLNQLGVFRTSLFGRFDTDFVSPNAFKKPEQQQQNIIDIPLTKGIDKQTVLGTYVDTVTIGMGISFFVRSVKRADF